MLRFSNSQQAMHSMYVKHTAQTQGSEKNTRRKHKEKMKLEDVNDNKVSAFCALQSNAYTHHKLTILVLTSFSIALTSSAALGTSVEPCREASNAEDCKSAAKE